MTTTAPISYVEPARFNTDYLWFLRLWPRPASRKTDIYEVRSQRTRELLGRVQWYVSKRQFCFFPDPGTLYNKGCLDSIAIFVDALNADHGKHRSDDA